MRLSLNTVTRIPDTRFSGTAGGSKSPADEYQVTLNGFDKWFILMF